MANTKLEFKSSKYIEEIFGLIENNLTDEEYGDYINFDDVYNHVLNLRNEYHEFPVVKDIITILYDPNG